MIPAELGKLRKRDIPGYLREIDLLPVPCAQHVIDHFLHAGVEEFLADEIGAKTGCADDPVASDLPEQLLRGLIHIAEAQTLLMHFNGERFLGQYE